MATQHVRRRPAPGDLEALPSGTSAACQRRFAALTRVLILFTLATFLFGCSHGGPAVDLADTDTLARFETKIESLRQLLQIPGLSAAIVHKGELIWSRGFGLADIDDRVAASPDTPYGLESVSAPFAAYLLMQCVESGDLNLDTRLTDFGIDLGNDRITVRHLLTHTSEGAAGASFRYSGSRYARLTDVIEQIYGKPYRSVLREEILELLGMTNTSLHVGSCGWEHYASNLEPGDPENALEPVFERLATPYQYDSDYEAYAVPVPTYADAAAGMISTVEDLARFVGAMQRDELVSKDTQREMFAPTQLTSGVESPHGLGWFTETCQKTQLIWHYGSGAYSSLILLVPEHDLAFIALANSPNLSHPFGLGWADVSVLASPVALEFAKEFAIQPGRRNPLPRIDWTAAEATLIDRLADITDDSLRDLFENELWAYRKALAGAGRMVEAHALLNVHEAAFPDSYPSARDSDIARRPSARPEEPQRIELSDTELDRWRGTYAIRPEDAASGLPAEIEIRVVGERILAIPSDGTCQKYIPVDSTVLAADGSPELTLAAAPVEGSFAGFELCVKGTTVATYDRLDPDDS